MPRNSLTLLPLRASIAVALLAYIGWTGCTSPSAAPMRSGTQADPSTPGRSAYAPRSPSGPQIVAPSAHPVVRSVRVGRSVHGNPLNLIVFGNGENTTLIIGGTHGNEPSSVFVAERLVALLHQRPDLVAGRTVAILVNANPDGLAIGSRYNVRRVDLNRNFPSACWRPGKRHGDRPASEPETRAMIAAYDHVRPDRVVAIHSISGLRYCNNYDGPARPLAERMAEYNGYPVSRHIGYPTPGSFGAWVGIDRDVPAITLELPKAQDEVASWLQNRDALLAVIGVEPYALSRAGQPPVLDAR